METRRFSIEHPNHPVPDDVAVSNRNLLEDGFATLSRQEEITLLAQPDEEERFLNRSPGPPRMPVGSTLTCYTGSVKAARENLIG
jgi:hypothetical protein